MPVAPPRPRYVVRPDCRHLPLAAPTRLCLFSSARLSPEIIYGRLHRAVSLAKFFFAAIASARVRLSPAGGGGTPGAA